MNAVAEKPKATKPRAAAPEAAPQTLPAEPWRKTADALALTAAETLHHMVIFALYDDMGQERNLSNGELEEANHILGRLTSPSIFEADSTDPEEGDILQHLALASSALDGSDHVMNRGKSREPIPVQVAIATIITHAADLADRLFHAYKGLPETLDDLHALTTFAGSKPQRKAIGLAPGAAVEANGNSADAPASASDARVPLEVISEARWRLSKAMQVALFAAEHHGDDAVFGLKYLIEWIDGRFEDHTTSPIPGAGDRVVLLAYIATALTVLDDINARLECMLLGAIRTILEVASDTLNKTTVGAKEQDS